ncbi:hypothetical protein HPB51_000601 [Rhipicephalus microplus]|uniref:Uncharacterized protein n=1 Tax=Rhipicephalus microplus TaxID=6941 RepID=A0A9J6EVZ0_RHIMP|nr:hypothetical protein HPB51_000601 [Rhipicephalus microplus]
MGVRARLKEYFKIIFRPVGGLDLHTTTHGVLLKTLCNLDIIDYEAVHTADRVRINPYNNSHTVSTPFKPRARLYLCASELHLGTISYSLRAYMAAPDDALHGVIYNAVISQTQDEIIQNLQSMNLNSPYTIADAHQMGLSKSILINFVSTTILPSIELDWINFYLVLQNTDHCVAGSSHVGTEMPSFSAASRAWWTAQS